MVPAGYKAKLLLSVNHTTETIHYHVLIFSAPNATLSFQTTVAHCFKLNFLYHFQFFSLLDIKDIYVFIIRTVKFL